MVLEITLQIVQDARLAGLKDLLKAAATHARRITFPDLDHRRFRACPIRPQNSVILFQKRKADPVIGDDHVKGSVGVVQNLVEDFPRVNLLRDMEKRLQFFFPSRYETVLRSERSGSAKKEFLIYS